jgi:hypothetical protein
VCILYNSENLYYKGIQIKSTKILNGIIIFTITGAILSIIPQTQKYIIELISLLSSGTAWFDEILLSSFTIPVWLLSIISILAFITLIKFFLLITNNSTVEYKAYVKDFIYGTNWRWRWKKDEIVDLQCYCPICDSLLVYDESSCHTRYTDVSKTDFICENCKSQIVTSIHGGNKKYAFSAVKREIERRIRTDEYKSNISELN